MFYDSRDDRICPEYWERIYVAQYNDTFFVKPCCLISKDESVNLDITDPTKIFKIYNQSEKIQTLRQNNLQGKIDPACLACTHLESNGITSARMNSLDRSKKQRDQKLLRHVDLNLGNLCNLACAICGPYASSRWVPLHKKMFGIEVDQSMNYHHKNRPVINDPEWFSNIDTLQLQGGEIFLQPAYIDFFKNLSKHKNLNEISVIIYTNVTVLPDQELFSLLSSCKNIRLNLSIDDIQDRFEYQRFGANWQSVLENISWYVQNCKQNYEIILSPTASLLNIYYYPEYREFFSNLFPDISINYCNFYNDSTNGPFGIKQLPSPIFQIIKQKLSLPEYDMITDFITEGDVDFNPFIDYIKKYDLHTGMSYQSSHHEFWKMITTSAAAT